jgi:very-short-patch-repair endonuclease
MPNASVEDLEMNQEPWQTNRARSLRREMTPAESKLWTALRGRRFAGIKFRRQFPVGYYIVDFFCFNLQLALEIDGESHLGKETHDDNRQKEIESTGIKIMRFWNTEVYDDFDAVLEAIWLECERRMSESGITTAPESTALTPGPSPRGRGEKCP